jgi:hypothetical protein
MLYLNNLESGRLSILAGALRENRQISLSFKKMEMIAVFLIGS